MRGHRGENERKEQLDKTNNRFCYCHNRSAYDRLFLAFIAGTGLHNPSPPRHVIQSAPHRLQLDMCRVRLARHGESPKPTRADRDLARLRSQPPLIRLTLLEQRLLDIMHRFS